MKRGKGGSAHQMTWSAVAAASTLGAPAVESDERVDDGASGVRCCGRALLSEVKWRRARVCRAG
jgi:hypothetical protein